MLRSLIFAACLIGLAGGAGRVAAQEQSPPSPVEPPADAPDGAPGSVEEGMDLLGQGIDMLLRGLVDEITPELERLTPELRKFAQGMGPMLQQLAEMMGEIDAYHPPERLPNGDIILRRKTPGEMEREDLDPPAEGEVDI